MILTGPEIKKRIAAGEIQITPYNEANVNPNSVNLTLDNKLLVYQELILDANKPNKTREIIIPKEGFILQPNKLYLGSTVEFTESKNLVPIINGRSSIGRLGLFVHVTAGFGDTGFAGKWTLELMATQPIKIYPGMKICQIYYNTVEGEVEAYAGKYQGAQSVQASELYKDKK